METELGYTATYHLDLAPDAIPGLADAGHTFYTIEKAARLYEALQGVCGGTIALVVSALPYKYHGAPGTVTWELHLGTPFPTRRREDP